MFFFTYVLSFTGRTRSGRLNGPEAAASSTQAALGRAAVVTAAGWEEELMELPITISQTIETDNTFDKLVFSVKVKEIAVFQCGSGSRLLPHCGF
jgi:hypothetical protein